MSISHLDVEQLKDPLQSAKEAGLRYISDQASGYKRKRAGKGFRYADTEGKIINNLDVLARIKSLAIPPAWTDVWISPDPEGHLQATGRDARGRKQFRYHRRWREVRDETKYTTMVAFAKALPRIRRRIARDLKLPGLTRNKVLATVVRLLEVSLIRVGNEEYARENDSFGLTTLRNKHVDVNGSKVTFHFRGKSGKWHEVDVRDRRLAKIVRSCQALPGQELFQYIDGEGKRQDVKSGDVNDYLREICGEDFTAKDFRTWAGTVLGALALRAFETFENQTQAKKNIVDAIEMVAERLGNTPAVCRKCYIHPEIFMSYLDGTLAKYVKACSESDLSQCGSKLRGEEAEVLHLLQRRLALEQKRKKPLPILLKASLAAIKKGARAANGKAIPRGKATVGALASGRRFSRKLKHQAGETPNATRI
jgi:DNA topoisomerase-1